MDQTSGLTVTFPVLNATKIGGCFNESEKVPVNYRFVVSVCVANKFSFTKIHRVSRHFLMFLFCFFTRVIMLIRKIVRKMWKVTICQLINEMHTS